MEIRRDKMSENFWNKITGFFESIKKENEQHAQEIAEKRWTEIQKTNRRRMKEDSITKAIKQLSKANEERKLKIEKQFNSDGYQEFETVMEMIYVTQKAHYKKAKWNREQKEEFDKKFHENFIRCQKKPEFEKDYADYVEATKRGFVKKPQDQRDIVLNKMLEEIKAIDLACQPLVIDDKNTAQKQKATRIKYETLLNRNKIKRYNNTVCYQKAIEI